MRKRQTQEANKVVEVDEDEKADEIERDESGKRMLLLRWPARQRKR